MAFCNGCQKCFNNIAGAGVLIITDSKLFEGEHDIILFKDHTGKYNDAGGKAEGNNSFETGKKELLEESRGTISVSLDTLSATKYYDVGVYSKHKYRCFIVYIRNVSCRKFYTIDTSQMSSAYQETSHMTRFPIRYLIDDVSRTRSIPKSIRDDYGTRRDVGDRVHQVLTKLF